MADDIKEDKEDVKDEKKDEVNEIDEDEMQEDMPGNVSDDEEVRDTEEQVEEDDSLPFPMATVVRQVKKRTHRKMISSKVKVAMNEFLGDVVSSVANEMGKTRYSMVEMDDFNRATKPYTYARELEKEKERVVGELERMKADLESLIREFERKFALAGVDDLSVLKKSQQA
ncbi:MAG: hypothetical protein DRN71_05315 [Candidatus Nanohalarchaeota archaeon]|nr:MAG: hypothetical protein DRN71_05315 [Candidatus Nanohaloarchaeota archaeon]